MDKNNLISMFNTQITSFINDLILVYPDDKDLYTFKTSLKMLLLYDDKKVIKMFKEFVYSKYKVQIENKDSEFFLQNDYEDIIAQTNTDTPEITAQLINKIKSYWVSMSNENKEIVVEFDIDWHEAISGIDMAHDNFTHTMDNFTLAQSISSNCSNLMRSH